MVAHHGRTVLLAVVLLTSQRPDAHGAANLASDFGVDVLVMVPHSQAVDELPAAIGANVGLLLHRLGVLLFVVPEPVVESGKSGIAIGLVASATIKQYILLQFPGNFI